LQIKTEEFVMKYPGGRVLSGQMIGTVLNVIGILTGGILGLLRRQPLSRSQEIYFKVVTGAFVVFFGLRLTWTALQGSIMAQLKQLLIAVVAMSLGKMIGKLLYLQKFSNHLGRSARGHISSAHPDARSRLDAGFKTSTALFCAAPLGLVGAVMEGLFGDPYPLALKAVMDSLATMGFVSLFGWGVMLSALPVLACQGTLALLCAQWLGPFLSAHGLTGSVQAVGGLIIFSVGLVIFEVKKIELADYFPSLAVAPLLTWIWPG
jgi:uncharacterized protein